MTAAALQSELAPCGDCACFNLRKAARAVTQSYDAALQPLGLRATQFTILVAAARLGPIHISDLAARLVMDRTTLSRDLGPLERQGWVRIGPGEDRRARAVQATAKGRRLLERALPLWRDAQARVVEGLGASNFHGMLAELSSTVSVVRAE